MLKMSLVMLALLIGIGIFNVLTLNDATISITGLITAAEEEAKPAEIKLVKIIHSDCSDCFDIDKTIDTIKGANVNVIDESTLELSSNEAKDLIDKYDIEKIPTLVITGETDKSNVKSLWKRFGEVKDDGTFIFTKLTPVYVDAETKEILGRVSLTYIKDSSCDGCVDLSDFIEGLKQAGVQITEEVSLEYTSDGAQELIQKYDVKKIPALIISDNLLEYESIQQIWNQLNTTKNDGFYTLHAMAPPYRDLETKEIVGLVSVIYLDDESCFECYDVNAHKNVLPRFGIVIKDEKTYDISSDEGSALVNKYNIINVPTVLLSPEANVYLTLQQIWTQVGTVEDDGWYVFTSTRQMGPYKDLSTGEVVNPTTQTT